MRLNGVIGHASAILVGRTYAPGTDELTQHDAVLDALAPLGVPIIGGVDCGHWAPYMPLVNGALAIVELVSDVDKICGRPPLRAPLRRATWAHRPADRRYDGRALAESAKTLAWRYAMGRTPSLPL